MAINAQRIRSLREQRGWSQEQLADVSGLSARTIQRVEASGTASLETRMALAAALELAPSDLLTAKESPGTPLPDSLGAIGRRWTGEHIALTAIFVVFLVVFLQVVFGYFVGRDMAFRDNDRARSETIGSKK